MLAAVWCLLYSLYGVKYTVCLYRIQYTLSRNIEHLVGIVCGVPLNCLPRRWCWCWCWCWCLVWRSARHPLFCNRGLFLLNTPRCTNLFECINKTIKHSKMYESIWVFNTPRCTNLFECINRTPRRCRRVIWLLNTPRCTNLFECNNWTPRRCRRVIWFIYRADAGAWSDLFTAPMQARAISFKTIKHSKIRWSIWVQ